MKKKKALIIIFSICIFMVLLFLCWVIFNMRWPETNSYKEKPVNSEERANVKPFNKEETNILGLKVDMEIENVEKILGKPNEIEKKVECAFGEVKIYHYDFGYIRFEPYDKDKYKLSSIFILNNKIRGPREIKIGDKVQEVLNKFPNDNNSAIENNMKFLYQQLGKNDGVIQYSPDGKIIAIVLQDGGGGFGTYYLNIQIENDRVKSIYFGVINI